WNEIINQPGQSYVNDVINLFDTSGTAASPVNVHDNDVDGLYPLDTATTWDSGSGITTDGDPILSEEPAYIDIHNNTVVRAGSAGIGVPDGHNILIYDNTLVCSGYLADGSEFFASGTGIYINDINGGNPSIFYGNGAYDNSVGWIQPPHSQQNGLNVARPSDYVLPDADASLVYGNVDLDQTESITTATENAADAAWAAQLSANSLTVGALIPPETASSSAPPQGSTAPSTPPTPPTAPTPPSNPPAPSNPPTSTGNSNPTPTSGSKSHDKNLRRYVAVPFHNDTFFRTITLDMLKDKRHMADMFH
ncbi:MAG TPA: hypothetical protein VGG44_09795, partial [Tepidisphaeraceae bacterium]